MRAPERASLEHDNWIAYLTGVVRCADAARVHRDGGVVAILSEIPFDWFNQALVERQDATAAGLIGAVEEGLGHGGGFVVRLRDGADDRFVATLDRAGLVAAGEATVTPGMVAFPIDRTALAEALAPSRLPGFELRQVVDAVGIDDHRRVVSQGFGTPPSVALGTTCTELLDRPECVVYVGYVDGVPVASGLGWRTGRTIGAGPLRRSAGRTQRRASRRADRSEYSSGDRRRTVRGVRLEPDCRDSQYNSTVMSILKVAPMGHPVIRAKARAIERGDIKTATVQKLIDDMVEGRWTNPETGKPGIVPYKMVVIEERLDGAENAMGSSRPSRRLDH